MRKPIIENRDEKVKGERLEIRLSKVEKDNLRHNAEKQGLDLSKYILKMCLLK